MRKLANRLARIDARNWTMLAIALMNLCWLYNRSFEGLWKVLFVVPAFGALARGFARREFELDRFTLLLAASCGFLFLSAFINRKLSVNALIKLICYITFMLYPAVTPRDAKPGAMRREVASLSALIAAALLPLMALGVASMLLNRSIQLPGMQNAIGVQYAWDVSPRLLVLDHTNVTGKFAALAIPLCLYLLHQRLPGAARALICAAIAVFALALAHTQSRTAICALCVGMGAVAFHFFCLRFRDKRWRAPAGLFVWLAAAALTLALLLGALQLDARVTRYLSDGPAQASAEEAEQAPAEPLPAEANPEAEAPVPQEPSEALPLADVSRVFNENELAFSSNSRLTIWKATFSYLADHPLQLLFGMGPADIMHPIAEACGVEFDSYSHLHNAFLELLARGGIFCLLSMLAALALLVRPAARMLLAPEVEGDRGAYLLPVFLGMCLIVAMAELPVFAVASYENLLFFLFAGHIARLKREQKLG